MSIAAWILLSLTLVVTVVLLPQVAKSRRMMGQARNDDRFSQGMRVLELAEAPSLAHSVEVAIHRKTDRTMQQSVTRPIKMAQDLRTYTDLKSRRAAAAFSRSSAARRRLALLGGLAIEAVAISGFAAAGMLAWWVLAAPGAGILLTLGWGSVAARKGRREDLRYLEDIRAVERRLEKSPAGRAALHAGKLRSNSHWAKVAQESLKSETREGSLNEALQKANEVLEAQSGEDSETVTAPETEQTVQNAEMPAVVGDKVDQSVQNNTNQKLTEQNATETPVDTPEKNKWNPTAIPVPSYTLHSDLVRRDVSIAAEVTGQDWEDTPVPMRPKIAQIMPAGEALTSEEIQSSAPVDLETILERRRA
ncbi:MAG: hypothetical protein SPK50_01790 [Mobiluncus porci]|uniref:hypothetical protein n=1 Tax=Mobiluncus porci TaxID=2652278 RepID=UPI0023F53A12|nr:hypothetical protein [Mobiluncus porci]MDD7541369.1 hypothetical protein [Mobiluncus porci]MDY5747852.1 hypothetical protein [Mobiluncus porci]